MDLRSNLSKARGLGSAHEGANHWKMQRITAVALIPLVIWFVISVIKATSISGLGGVIYLLSSPINAIAMILFLGTAVYHGSLGIKVIIEDYVHCHLLSNVLDMLNKFVATISVVAVTFAIFYVHLKTYNNSENNQPAMFRAEAPKINGITQAVEVDNSDSAANAENKSAEPVVEIETPKE